MSKAYQSTFTGETNTPYSKQFVHSKSSQYRRLKTEWKNNVYLARSRIQGLGLYAAKDIEKHTMVIEYIGTIIRNEVANRREKIYEEQVGLCWDAGGLCGDLGKVWRDLGGMVGALVEHGRTLRRTWPESYGMLGARVGCGLSWVDVGGSGRTLGDSGRVWKELRRMSRLLVRHGVAQVGCGLSWVDIGGSGRMLGDSGRMWKE